MVVHVCYMIDVPSVVGAEMMRMHEWQVPFLVGTGTKAHGTNEVHIGYTSCDPRDGPRIDKVYSGAWECNDLVRSDRRTYRHKIGKLLRIHV
jgi:hypothetical protein